jgi:hypothetical protein
MESGSSSLIREYLREHKLTADRFSGLKVNDGFAREPGEMDKTPPEGFLYQPGYLSLRKAEDGTFSFDYPNFEVRSSMNRLFMDNLLAGADQNLMRLGLDLEKHLKSGDVPMVVENFRRMYAGARDADRAKVDLNLKDPNDFALFVRQTQGESFYRATLYSYLTGCGLDVETEAPNNSGFADIELVFGKKVYIFEIKVVGPPDKAAAAAEAGLEQIRGTGYGGQHAADPARVSLAVSTVIRNIAACAYDADGGTVLWESGELREYLAGERRHAGKDGPKAGRAPQRGEKPSGRDPKSRPKT